MQKIAKNSPFAHHHTALSGYIFATKAFIDNQKKLVKQQFRILAALLQGTLHR